MWCQAVKLGLEKICCVIDSTKVVEKARQRCKLVEARLDLLGINSGLKVVKKLSSSGLKVVATLRDWREGGMYRGPPEEKLDVLEKALEAGAWLVDVEYRFELLDRALERLKGKVILSYHNFNHTPEPEILYAMAGDMLRNGATLAKIATMARRVEDNFRLLGINARWPGKVIAFAMGSMGRLSRILAPIYGAPYTYATLGKPLAPGQPTIDEILYAWRLLGLQS
ncbi:MAG TPA: type I 3-dehydroquinate dehydratase [Pyrodictium sp.]|nr:type I 3-dehydroquinate dehydratase [Pyrodictium sp.]